MNIRKTVIGIIHLLEQERSVSYPGGRERAIQRREIIARHVRPVSLSCLSAGMYKEAWHLYHQTTIWHLLLGRWKYLLGFPLFAFFKAALAKYKSRH